MPGEYSDLGLRTTLLYSSPLAGLTDYLESNVCVLLWAILTSAEL